MEEIKIHDKHFVPFLSHDELEKAIRRMANTIYKKHHKEVPVFIGVLNGVVLFMSDFLQNYPGDCEITFMKMSSYVGTQSTGDVKQDFGITMDLTDRVVIIMEDIVDTGNTLEKLYEIIQTKPVKSVEIATLLFKPDAFAKDLNIDHIGISIPDKFVVGYGLDYDGLGRNYPDIYQIKEEE